MVKKCYTTKYRKHKEKAHRASLVRKARIQKEEARYWAICHERKAAAARERAEKLPYYQSLVNVLAKRICQLDDRYVGMLRIRELFKMTNAFGINPYPEFPVLPNGEEIINRITKK